MKNPQNPPSNHSLILVAVFLFALGLRLWSIQFGLPELYHADEPIIVNHALAFGSGDLNPHFFKIPPLISYLLFGFYGILFFIGKLIGQFQSPDDFANLFLNDPSLFYFTGRIIFGAFAGALSVIALYRMVEKNFDSLRAIVSAVLMSVSFIHVSDSHYIYADIPLVLCLITAFSAILGLTTSTSLFKHAIIGAFIGLCAATKYNGVFISIPYLFILGATSTLTRTQKMFLVFSAATSSCVFFFALNPYAILDSQTFLQELKAQSAANQGGAFLHHLTYSLAEGIGWPILGLSFLALIKLLANFKWISEKQSSARYAIALFCLAYYLVLVRWGQPYGRYVLPLVPFLIFLAADYCVSIFKSSTSKKWGAAVAIILCVGFGQNLIKSVYFNLLMSQADTRSLAQSWVMSNLPPGTKIAMDLDFAMPKLPFGKNLLEQKIDWVQSQQLNQENRIKRLRHILNNQKHGGYAIYSLSDATQKQSREFLLDKEHLPYDLPTLREKGITHILITRLWEKDIHQDFYDSLENETRLISTFNPYKNAKHSWSLEHPLTGGPFKTIDIFARERNGQPLYLYEIPA